MTDDMIRRQAAINTVFSMCCRWNTDDPNDLKNMLMTAFQDLPSAEPRWIPCSERLPESGVPVLISHVGFVTEDFLDIDELLGGAYFWNSGISLDEELKNLAWMPLPAPWKGEDDAEVH